VLQVPVNITAAVSPHWLRHARGLHAIECGASLPEVQATLGHRNIVRQEVRRVELHERIPIERRLLVSYVLILPATPTLCFSPPSDEQCLHEVKFDGWRIQLHKQDGSA
jgi:hypothetical protein